MPLNFVTTKPSNVISIWTWQHPELANYDPNVEEELEWMSRHLLRNSILTEQRVWKAMKRGGLKSWKQKDQKIHLFQELFSFKAP